MKIFLFIVALIALLVFQSKAVMPWVHSVISSDLFIEKDDGVGDAGAPVIDDMTQWAFEHCNSSIKNDMDEEFNVLFAEQPINAWGIGNYQYVINSEIEIIPNNAQSFSKRYVCRIKYTNKEDLTELSNLDNWSVNGISGLNDL